MKKVLLKKRKYTFRDVFRFIGLIILHFAFAYIFFTIVFGIHFLIKGNLFGDLTEDKWLMFYIAFVGPVVNALIHALYVERGVPWVRMVLWGHYFFILFATPIIAFVS